jgi:hypothetical protein
LLTLGWVRYLYKGKGCVSVSVRVCVCECECACVCVCVCVCVNAVVMRMISVQSYKTFSCRNVKKPSDDKHYSLVDPLK